MRFLSDDCDVKEIPFVVWYWFLCKNKIMNHNFTDSEAFEFWQIFDTLLRNNQTQKLCKLYTKKLTFRYKNPSDFINNFQTH